MGRVAACVVAVVALAAAGCGGDESYNDDVEESFTSECVKAATDGEGALAEAEADRYCQCTYDDIEANVPFEEFAEYDDAAREDENAPVPPKIAAAAERCAESLAG